MVMVIFYLPIIYRKPLKNDIKKQWASPHTTLSPERLYLQKIEELYKSNKFIQQLEMKYNKNEKMQNIPFGSKLYPKSTFKNDNSLKFRNDPHIGLKYIRSFSPKSINFSAVDIPLKQRDLSAKRCL